MGRDTGRGPRVQSYWAPGASPGHPPHRLDVIEGDVQGHAEHQDMNLRVLRKGEKTVIVFSVVIALVRRIDEEQR